MTVPGGGVSFFPMFCVINVTRRLSNSKSGILKQVMLTMFRELIDILQLSQSMPRVFFIQIMTS